MTLRMDTPQSQRYPVSAMASLSSKTEHASVASITTAYNATKVLPRHLDALLRQTRPIQEIVVVDNASTDGTAELIRDRFPHVTVLRMDENLGAAGAWAAGLAYAALQKRHDWIWAFDDDSVPGPDSLEKLLRGSQFVAESDRSLGIVAPLPVHVPTGTFYPPLLWKDGWSRPSDELLRHPTWFADLVIVSGCMVRREVVETIGLPRSDFFMDFFDFEYCLRARSRGFKIGVISEVRMQHEIGDARAVSLPGVRRLWPNHAPWREYYMTRNLAYAGWSLYPTFATKRFVVRHLARHMIGVVLFGKHKRACIRRMLQGFRDGTKGTLGIRFRPGDQA